MSYHYTCLCTFSVVFGVVDWVPIAPIVYRLDNTDFKSLVVFRLKDYCLFCQSCELGLRGASAGEVCFCRFLTYECPLQSYWHLYASWLVNWLKSYWRWLVFSQENICLKLSLLENLICLILVLTQSSSGFKTVSKY